HRARDHHAAAAGADLDRAEHEGGQGDAGHRAGPGRGAADGHQRQPHHLVHVPPRRRARGRGRPDVPAGRRHHAVQPRLPARPDRVHLGRARRHRQPHRRGARRRPHRPDPGPERRRTLRPRSAVVAERRVHDPDRPHGVSAVGPARPDGRGEGVAMAAISSAPRQGGFFPARLRWPVGLAAAAVLFYLFYAFIEPNLSDDAQTVFRDWLPLTSINEAMVWIICALGLNIVVGYAGLLDLGFVAFWAIGGYTAGWLMSSFGFDLPWLHVHILSPV